MAEQRTQSRLMVLMFTDIFGSVDLKQRLGDAVVADLIRRHDELFRGTIKVFAYAEVLKDVGDGFLASFSSASDAVHAALHFQSSLHEAQWNKGRIKTRVGIHLGEVSELDRETPGGRAKISGLAVDITARVMGLALPGQILMTRAAFDNARQYIREVQTGDGSDPQVITRKWIAHGRYLFKGAEEALEVFEVGEPGIAPLQFPPDSEKARRSVAADQEETLGWRPAVGMEIPERKGWVLERQLGEGGFGEVWLGESPRSHTRRVFKFCFDAERLKSLKRELMLFRLLRDALGDRNDIARLHEVQVDHPPFYLESEFTEDGSLVEWSSQQGGIQKIPLATRLDIMARTALAVSAAHSVGVLHKDIKPSNVLIYRGENGQPLPRLTDFGIGELTDPSQLAKRNITMVQMTQSLTRGSTGATTGTRIYVPPEVLAGKQFTIQGDVYALGIMLYQMVVGDLDRPLAQGWERDVLDPLLREDITRCVEGHESDRLNSAKELADRLQRLPARRRARKRRQVARVSGAASVVLVVLLVLAGVWVWREQRLRKQKEREADKAVATTSFLQRMLSVNPRDLPEGKGQDVKVVDLLDIAARDVQTAFPDEPEIEASLRWTIGNAYKSLGVYATAESQLRAALEIRRRVHGEQSEEVAQTLEDLSGVMYWDKRLPEAEQFARESLAMRESIFGAEHLKVASSLNYVAAILDAQKKSAEAEPLYRRALELRQKLATGKDRELVARSLNNLAKCLEHEGKLEEAEQKYSDAIALISELKGPEDLDVGNGKANLAAFLAVHVGATKYDQAQTLFDEALAIKRKKFPPPQGNPSLAYTLQALADLNERRGRLDRAEADCREALEMLRLTQRPTHPDIVAAEAMLRRLLTAQNKDPAADPALASAPAAAPSSTP